MRIVFWHVWYNPHLAPALRYLSEIDGNEVSLVVKPWFQNIRADMNWPVPDYGRTRLVHPNVENWRELVDRELSATTADTLHLISHHRIDHVCKYAWQRCADLGLRFGLYGPCPGVYSSSLGKLARGALYRVDRWRRLRNANPILPIAEQSVRFFRSNGYDPRRLFHWAYFVENPLAPPPSEINRPLSFIHIGRLVDRKNTQQLIKACDHLRSAGRNFTLSLIGDGPCAEALRTQIASLGLDGHVRFQPYIPFADVPSELARHDVLVLPSLCDDWGVIVNEALQAGLAVVVSDKTGSADLIRASGAGLVFKTGDDRSLCESLQQLIDQPEVTLEMRRRGLLFAPRFSPQAAAEYLHQICRHVLYGDPRPQAPWLGAGTPDMAAACPTTSPRC